MKHRLLTIIILLLTAVGYWYIAFAQDAAAKMSPPQNVMNIPRQIGQYKQVGEDQEASEYVKKVLRTSTILKRDYYSHNGRPVSLSIVYAGTTRASLHFPEVCLVGQGWDVREQTTMPVGFSFVARRLIIVNGNYTQAMLYWFKTDDKFTGNFFLNSWHWAHNQLLFNPKASAMIKVSTPIINQEKEIAFSALEDFSEKLTPILIDYVK